MPAGEVASKLIVGAVGKNIRGAAESFAYDGQNLLEAGQSPPREYESGGKLVTRGETTYAYDRDARLVEKRCRREDGSAAVWRYEWTARGLLSGRLLAAPVAARP